MFGKLSTAAKLWVLGLSAVIGVLALGLIGVLALSGMAGQIEQDLGLARGNSQAMVAVKTAQSTFLSQVQEWKNILIRGNDAESYEKYLKAFKARSNATQAQLNKAIELMNANGLPAHSAEALKAAHGELAERYLSALEKFDPKDPQAGKVVDKLVKGMDRATTDGMTQLVAEIERSFDARITDQIEAGRQRSASSHRWFIVLSLIGLLIVATLAFMIQRDIMAQLGGEPAYAAEVVRQIAQGSLNTRIELKEGDRGSLLASMSAMQASVRNVMVQIHEAADRMVAASRILAGNAHQVSLGSARQSESAAAMAAAIEEMTASINHVADSAGMAHTLAEEARGLSASSGQMVQETIRDINQIAQSVEASTRVVYSLGEQSEKISGIANVIKEIADQTNLLALNAAIEAARAGEQGRGFAVVADEVRKLAEKTTASTQEISAMIVAIQGGTQEAVKNMETGSKQVSAGVKTAAATGDSMAQIEAGASDVLLSVAEISNALREQASSSAQIALSIERIAEMTEENSAAVDEVSGSASELEALAGKLRQNVEHFRI